MTNTVSSPRHSIADVERDTGLSKDTLRVWERRYGFPTPQRDAIGERQYDDEQLLRLRHVRRLLDAGHRAGQVVSLPLDTLVSMGQQEALRAQKAGPAVNRAALSAKTPTPPTPAGTSSTASAPDLNQWLQLLRQHDALGLRDALQQHLQQHGLFALVRDVIAPMNVMVGQSWLDGQLAVFEEHLYTETVQALLRHAIGQLAATRQRQPPRVLLTTVPGEPHALGLLMAECMMALEGCETLSLGVQTPLVDIVAAARACRADVVALGFTALQNPREVRAALARLREQLPASVALWAGGQCPALYQRPRTVERSDTPIFTPMAQLSDIVQGVARWRQRQGSTADSAAHPGLAS
jgi:MerR family transcriptional regulator, light-induced transcriptional regulator